MCVALFSTCILPPYVPPHLFLVTSHMMIVFEAVLHWYILLRLLGSWLNRADMFADLQLNIFSFLHYSSYKEKTNRATMERMSWLVGWLVWWLPATSSMR